MVTAGLAGDLDQTRRVDRVRPVGRVRRLALVWALVLALVGVGCSSAPEVPVGPDGEPDPVLVLGRDVYESRCANCHGTNGQGGRGPQLNDGASVAAYPDPADMVAVVAIGLNAAMPAFGESLSPEEIDAVVAYVREVLG